MVLNSQSTVVISVFKHQHWVVPEILTEFRVEIEDKWNAWREKQNKITFLAGPEIRVSLPVFAGEYERLTKTDQDWCQHTTHNKRSFQRATKVQALEGSSLPTESSFWSPLPHPFSTVCRGVCPPTFTAPFGDHDEKIDHDHDEKINHEDENLEP